MELRSIWVARLAVLLAAGLAASAQTPRPGVFYDPAVRQAEFAAAEIAKAAAGAVPNFPFEQYSTVPCSPCVVLASSPALTARLTSELQVTGLRSAQPQAYAIRRVTRNGRDVIAVLANDAAGAMYGGFDVAEAWRLGTLAELKDSDHAPHIEQRGIKFNLPLDARTPSYSDNSDAAQNNIPEMWSFDFWREYLDEMARHRYNVLSLWNLHPFPSMVKVPEYPDVALDDVKRTTLRLDDTYSSRGEDMVRPEILNHLETVRTMTIDEKIRFWRSVMQYANDRGIQIYVFTWNIFTFGAEGKYGITSEQTNAKTIAYFRASVREMVLTYPLLAGIGITAGEHMSDAPGGPSKEKWLWQTYGEGLKDALALQPGRKVRLIHRYHESGQTEILNEFREYPQTMDLSFKYSVAHMYSIPNPPFIQDLLPHLPPGKRTWLTLRNDDVYSFRWGNPGYVRDYIRHIPGPDKVVGFNMGPDGYIWGREFLSAVPEKPRQLVISKQWFSFALWGRLSYEPDLPDSLFQRTLAVRFPGVDGTKLLNAWSDASWVFPLITRFFWNDIDLRWFPEASLSHKRYKGYFTVRHFIEGETMPGSGVLRILEWRRLRAANEKMTGVTPLEIADQLEQHAAAALAGLPSLRAGQHSAELRLTLGDIEAMAHLAQYYASKIRGAAALAWFDRTGEEASRAEAVRHLEAASAHWSQYAQNYTAQYTQPHLYNRVGFVDIPSLSVNVKGDIELARTWTRGTVVDENVRKNPADRLFKQ